MVKGRLKRESNPTPGTVPGFNPQHFKVDGSTVDTGENNPLPSKDVDVKAELVAIKAQQAINDSAVLAKLAALETKLNGTLNTQVTGSIAEYGWLHSQAEPSPSEVMAIGVRIEADHSMTTLYWNGSSWNGVV